MKNSVRFWKKPFSYNWALKQYCSKTLPKLVFMVFGEMVLLIRYIELCLRKKFLRLKPSFCFFPASWWYIVMKRARQTLQTFLSSSRFQIFLCSSVAKNLPWNFQVFNYEIVQFRGKLAKIVQKAGFSAVKNR